MKRSLSIIAGSGGFTLIEIIATLVVVGILAAFFIHFMGTAMNESWKSVNLVAGEAQAEGTMEQIIADYVREMNTNPDTALDTLLSKVNNHDYDSQLVTVTMAFIEFDNNGIEIPPPLGTSELLKVTARAPGNDLTIILPKSRWRLTDPIIEF